MFSQEKIEFKYLNAPPSGNINIIDINSAGGINIGTRNGLFFSYDSAVNWNSLILNKDHTCSRNDCICYYHFHYGMLHDIDGVHS